MCIDMLCIVLIVYVLITGVDRVGVCVLIYLQMVW